MWQMGDARSANLSWKEGFDFGGTTLSESFRDLSESPKLLECVLHWDAETVTN